MCFLTKCKRFALFAIAGFWAFFFLLFFESYEGVEQLFIPKNPIKERYVALYCIFNINIFFNRSFLLYLRIIFRTMRFLRGF